MAVSGIVSRSCDQRERVPISDTLWALLKTLHLPAHWLEIPRLEEVGWAIVSRSVARVAVMVLADGVLAASGGLRRRHAQRCFPDLQPYSRLAL